MLRLASLAALAALVAACTDPASSPAPSPYGTYIGTRQITMTEPSPDFQFANNVTIELAADHVAITPGDTTMGFVHTDTTVEFTTTETWPSTDGNGASMLTYELALGEDGTLSGSITADVIFDSPTFGDDFTFVFAISATKQDP